MQTQSRQMKTRLWLRNTARDSTLNKSSQGLNKNTVDGVIETALQFKKLKYWP